MQIHHLLEITGVPEIDRLLSDFDEKPVVEGSLESLSNRHEAPLDPLILNESLHILVVFELGVRRLIS